MQIDPYILAFSFVTVAITVWMGFRSAKSSKTASDFFVAGRSVGVGMNASAISGEYLSAASFMGIAGMVMSSGYDALWYPVCYACGYLFLLLFIAGPLRRFGAYTIPDFAEGRFDSPLFRKIAVVFVLFIGFFYTMPQMKGAGTTLGYIFQDLDFRGTSFEFLAPMGAKGMAAKGLNYAVGVFVVGAVITLNVALGGMKGITLVQAFQYWAKMFAISVPIFVLMAVYGHYGKQVGMNGKSAVALPKSVEEFRLALGEPDFGMFHLDFRNALNTSPEWTVDGVKSRLSELLGQRTSNLGKTESIGNVVANYSAVIQKRVSFGSSWRLLSGSITNVTYDDSTPRTRRETIAAIELLLQTHGATIRPLNETSVVLLTTADLQKLGAAEATSNHLRKPLPEKAPADATWLNPFGPLTTKAARNAAPVLSRVEADTLRAEFDAKHPATTTPMISIALRPGLSPDQRMTVNLDAPTVTQALGVYAELTGRQLLPNTNSLAARVDDLLGGKLSALKLVPRTPTPDHGVREHADGPFTAAEVQTAIETHLHTNGLAVLPVGAKGFAVERVITAARPAGFLEKAWLAKHEKPLALLYTYSLIIAIVCGTAGLPHILVRFYTNPDGVAAKKTTMWVMILIGVFYVFPPVFGALGRNLLPDLYNGLGAKGTDKIVLELPRLLNEKYAPLGSILSGITCAGAFAAFMSTFSGLLVSMTGALAHDVYGRILRPQSTPAERMKMFKVGAVIIGGVAILLGMQVEQLQINFMVGQAFAIAAASYFPLLFMAVWWRNLTMIGAATGMLTGGISALACISLTSFSDLKWVDLGSFWAAHPLLRILCEQPAIWAVPLAIVLMIIVSKLTASTIPSDSRMKMLVLHAPEELGLKQEYIQEHQHGPGH